MSRYPKIKKLRFFLNKIVVFFLSNLEKIFQRVNFNGKIVLPE